MERGGHAHATAYLSRDVMDGRRCGAVGGYVVHGARDARMLERARALALLAHGSIQVVRDCAVHEPPSLVRARGCGYALRLHEALQ
jgi:hypothetical protein